MSNAGSLKMLNCAILNCAIAYDQQLDQAGGGIYNAGDLLMRYCTISNCTAPLLYFTGYGGGIANEGELIMEDCAVSGCGAGEGGGLLNGGTSWLTRCIIEACFSASKDGDGGGVFNLGTLVLQSCTVSNCNAAGQSWGGGVNSYGALAATNSTFVQNHASMYGGGLLSSGSSILSGCTISGNSASYAGGVCGCGTLLNCTVSQNSSEGIAGGIADGKFLGGVGVLSLSSCTVVSNYSYYGAAVSGDFQSQNCIIAGNGAIDVYGVLHSMGYNLIQNTNGCTISGDQTGNIYGVAPLLGALQDNGGPTWTHALLPGSPAIDKGSSGGLATDQRGKARTFDMPSVPNAADGSDIGAYEACNFPPYFTASMGGGLIVVKPGETIRLHAATAGDLPLYYQWQFDGVPLLDGSRFSGTSRDSMTIANVQPIDEGIYQLIVTNVGGRAVDLPVRVVVLQPPQIMSVTSLGSGGVGS
jgi:hypothetical protein